MEGAVCVGYVLATVLTIMLVSMSGGVALAQQGDNDGWKIAGDQISRGLTSYLYFSNPLNLVAQRGGRAERGGHYEDFVRR